jgi:macrodomain Ter protein organizer (MatP/YcbG family)
MKNNTLISALFTVLLLFVSLFAFGQSVEKTLVKSFNLKGHESVSIEMDAPVEVKTWDNTIMRVQIQINLENGSDALLKSLVQAGRYNLRNKIEDGEYKVYAPALDMQVKIGGKPLQDHVSFIVYKPKKVTVTLPGNNDTKEEVTGSVN